MFFPFCKILEKPVFTEKFQFHQFIEVKSFFFPSVQRNKSRVLLTEIRNTSRTYCNVFIVGRKHWRSHCSVRIRNVWWSGSLKFNNSQIVRVTHFFQIAKFVRYASILLDELDEIVRRQRLIIFIYFCRLVLKSFKNFGPFAQAIFRTVAARIESAFILLQLWFIVVTAASQKLIRNYFFLVYAIVSGDFSKKSLGRWLLELGLEIAFVMEEGRLLVFGAW